MTDVVPADDPDTLPPVDALPNDVADPGLMKVVLSRMFERHRRQPLRIGRLTVLDRLGEGGMGVVYAAYDAQLDRKVAVKVLHPRAVAVDDVGEARLLREAQAMARLTHPNVVAVYEAGSTEDGVHLSMEFIRGVSLDAWLRGVESRSWREVVRVFLEAGRGLAAAHRAGLVHRDFKPHNVMIGHDGAVKVLDFGLARATAGAHLDERVSSRGTGDAESALDRALTRTGAVMGTPAYMAPEQHQGQLATERSDQFSYCIALHEALHGRLPFPCDSLATMAKAAAEGHVLPPPPGSSVPAWIDRVVSRGLAADPADRFPSMDALLTALDRDPAARRRRGAATLTIAVAIGTGGFALARASQERPPAGPTCDDARTELAGSWEAGRRAAIERATTSVGAQGPEVWDRIAPQLDAYAEGWITMRDESCRTHLAAKQSDTLFDLRTACLDQRRATFDALTGLLVTPDAAALDKAPLAVAMLPPLSHCADTAALTARVPAPEDPRTAAAVQHQREQLARAKEHEDLGQYRTGLALADEAIETGRARGHGPLEAEGLLRRGSLLMEGGTPLEAEATLTEALLRAIATDHPEVAVEAASKRMFVRGEWMREVSRALEDRGLVEALFEQVPHARRQYGVYLNNLGLLLSRADAYDEASAIFERALAVKREAFGARHPEIAFTLANVGLFRRELGDPMGARAHLEEAVHLARETLGPSHAMTSTLSVLLAQALADLGARDASRTLVERVRRLQERDTEAGTARMHDALIALGELDLHDRRFEAARETFERALAIAEANGGGFLTLQPLVGLGLAHVGLGEPDVGLRLGQRALETTRDAMGEEHEAVAVMRIELAEIYERAGLDAEAAAHYRAALAVLERGPDPQRATIARTLARLAAVVIRSGDPNEAVPLATRALEIFAELGVRDGPAAAEARGARGRAHWARGRGAEAIADLREAEAWLSTPERDADDFELALIRFALAQALGSNHADADAAEALAREALAMLVAKGEPFAPEARSVEAWLGR